MIFLVCRRCSLVVPRTIHLALIVPALAVVLASTLEYKAAAAAEGGIGVVNAVADPQFPTGQPIAVVAEEFTDLNTQLQDVVERALVAHGFTVTQNAPLILSFDTEMTNATADVQDRAGGNIVGSGEPGAAPPYEEFLSEEFGSNLGDEPPEIANPQISMPLGGGGLAGGSQYSLSFTLGRDGRPPVWEGSVTATLPTSDPFAAAQAMVPVLVSHVGRTVRGERVAIQ